MPATDGVERLAVVFDDRLALVGGPGQDEDIEASRILEQAPTPKEVEGGLGQSFLLAIIDGSSCAGSVFALSGPNLDEDDGTSLDGDEVDLMPARRDIAGDDTKPKAAQIPLGRPLRSRAEPTPPPGLARAWGGHGSNLQGRASKARS